MRIGNGSAKSTQDLVRETIAGEREAFELLVDRYRDAVSAVAYSYLGGFDDVQDAVQEAFVHAYCNLRQLREPEKFGPWLRRIAANSCAMALRKRERSSISLEEIAEQPSSADDARRIASRAVVSEALSKLSDTTRLTVTLSYIDGYSHSEVAEFLEVPITAVRSRLRHAKRKLREEMLEMVEDVLHEDKPGDELAKRIVEYASRSQSLMMADSNEAALRLCDEALAAIDELSQSATPEELRELLLRTVRSSDGLGDDKERALRNLKDWSVDDIKAREAADILLRQADVLLRMGDVDGAKKRFEDAASRMAAVEDEEASAKLVASIASSYARNHQGSLAREWLPEALANARTAGNTPAEAMHTWTLATTYLEDAQPALARPLLRRAGELFREANEPSLAVMAGAALHLIDDVGEERWDTLEQYICFCLALKKTGSRIEVSDKGYGWGSKPDEHDWKPEVGVLFRIDYHGLVFDASLPPGAAWRGTNKWFRDAHMEGTTTVVSYDESVESTLGRFSRCLLLETVVRDTLKDDETEETRLRVKRMCGKRSSWFAPGVGLVRFVAESEEGSVSVVDLKDYETAGHCAEYLPLAVGNSWTYWWPDAPGGAGAKERYEVAGSEGGLWYLENYRYVMKRRP